MLRKSSPWNPARTFALQLKEGVLKFAAEWTHVRRRWFPNLHLQELKPSGVADSNRIRHSKPPKRRCMPVQEVWTDLLVGWCVRWLDQESYRITTALGVRQAEYPALEGLLLCVTEQKEEEEEISPWKCTREYCICHSFMDSFCGSYLKLWMKIWGYKWYIITSIYSYIGQ